MVPNNILSIRNDEMIGYITIDKIRVELPIYYGTNDHILSSAIGLLEGSSFPIGEVGTHTVLSGHRGLPTSKLFTDLDKLEIGDVFNVRVLDRTMSYEVDKISIVLPNEVDNLSIEEDSEYVTLMTCTPYGINSHRLLVRAHRTSDKVLKSYVSTDAFKVDRMLMVPIMGIPIIFLWLLFIIFKPVNMKIDIYKYVYPNNNYQSKIISPSDNFNEKEAHIFNKYVYLKDRGD